MATIKYCDYINGHDDTGDGSYGNPYKTITKASTGLQGGDEVRVAKSPDNTALTGTIAFTKGSTAIVGTSTLFTTELAIGDFVLGGDSNWWEVVTITDNTHATLYQKYSGENAASVSSSKLGITSTGAAASSSTAVQTVSASGSSGSNLKISGGWDLSSQQQTGQTYFRQMHETFANRYGYGLYFDGKNYTEISRLHFLRYYYGIYYYNSNNNTATSPTCNSNSYYGIYYSSSNNNTATSLTTTGNSTAGVYQEQGLKNYLFNASIAEATEVSIGSGYGDSYFYSQKHDQTLDNDWIWTYGATINKQSTTTQSGSGYAWKFAITDSTRTSIYPVKLSIAKIAVAANKQVTVKAYLKKDHATNVGAKIICRGGQIAGVDSDVSTTKADDTNWEQLTLTFTPTEVGVVEIECHAWYVSGSSNVYIDTMTIEQAS